MICGSYYRFIVLHEYTVAYEGDCDPYSQSCFYDCEDEECTAEYYYSIIERQADEVLSLCGPDITDCDAAYECQSDVRHCSITFCEPEIDGEDACASFDNSI